MMTMLAAEELRKRWLTNREGAFVDPAPVDELKKAYQECPIDYPRTLPTEPWYRKYLDWLRDFPR